jgi:hypothetical protein
MTAVVDRDRPARVRYRFSPLERRGVIAGWRGGQIASVAAGLFVGVLALRSRPTAGGVLVAVVGVGAAVTLAFWPIRGRTGEQWLPLLVRRLVALSTGTRLQLATGPRAGHLASVDLHRPGQRSAVVGPAGGGSRARGRRTVFSGVEILAVPTGDDRWSPEVGIPVMGMVVDRPARTATAVLAVRGHSFALLGHGEQDSTIADWARVLSSMAREGTDVHRVQWLESCLPDDGGAVRQHRSRHAVLDPGSPAGRSYQALLDESSPATRRHRVLLAVSVHTSHSARVIRSSGGGLSGAAAVLGREILSLQHALGGTDVTVDGVLGPGALRRVIREASCRVADTADPDGTERRSGRVVGDRQEDRSTGSPWPMAMEPRWDAIRTDATWHATYWIAEWPRVEVTPDFLGPLLFSPLRRTITLTMEPVSPSRAARQVAQARTADIADGELRRRSGFLVTARHVREKESVEERDVELADGHAQYRFSGYVTVTGDDRHELGAACAAVEQAAGQAGIELRLLYGEQDVAFTCSLPLGRGLS